MPLHAQFASTHIADIRFAPSDWSVVMQRMCQSSGIRAGLEVLQSMRECGTIPDETTWIEAITCSAKSKNDQVDKMWKICLHELQNIDKIPLSLKLCSPLVLHFAKYDKPYQMIELLKHMKANNILLDSDCIAVIENMKRYDIVLESCEDELTIKPN
jgi:hypothetical protein